MKNFIQIASFLLLLTACSKELKPITIQTSEGNVIYYVEIADTKEKQTRGLMYRTHLKIDSGMIFVFGNTHPQPIAMWMKNTYIPLDMLFLDESKTIIGIAQNTEPLNLKIIQPTTKPSTYVIELNAGEVKKHNIKLGDKVLY